jgi:hypothetical protein
MDEPREPTKRELRQQKRAIKRAGSQRRRRMLKQVLRENPDDAPLGEFDFGRFSSAPFNGLDHDATRTRRPAKPPRGNDPEDESN